MKYIIFAILFFFYDYGISQEKAVLTNGDSINVYSDGTWEYANERDGVDNWKPLNNITASIEKEEIDPYDKTKLTTTKSWISIGKSSTGALVFGSAISLNNTIGFHIGIIEDLGCLSNESSKILVKLANGEIVELTQVSQKNCTPTQSATFLPIPKHEIEGPKHEALMKANLDKLIRNNWVSLRIYGTEHQADITPSETEKYNGALFFREHLQALGYTPN